LNGYYVFSLSLYRSNVITDMTSFIVTLIHEQEF